VFAQPAALVTSNGAEHLVRTADGASVLARSVVLATGVTWRRLGVPTLERLVGAGVFYGAAGSEARAMSGCDVYVVGAGNSAGQAAVHLAKYGARVTMIVHGESLSSSMSSYLIREIASVPAIDVRVCCEVVDGAGDDRLESVTVRDNRTGACEARRASALFAMIGGEPQTGWLDGVVQRDRTGYSLLDGTLTPLPASRRRASRSVSGWLDHGMALTKAANTAGAGSAGGVLPGRSMSLLTATMMVVCWS
jgi:thioredoxin reductase (NADPH)